MSPEQQDPTQVVEAPDTGITPANQADLSGQVQDPPEGGTVEELTASNKRLKEQLAGRKKEAEVATTKLGEYEQSQRLAALQQPAPQTIYQQPPVNSQPQWDPETFLTPEEEAEHDKAGENLLKNAVDKMNLTARGYHRILKLARTIADLAEEKNITGNHIAEALQYREKPFAF